MDVDRVAGLLHAVVCVPDLEASLTFYRDLLGGRVTYSWEHDTATLAALTGYDTPSARAAVVTYPDDSEIELCEFRRPRGSSTVTREWFDAGINFITFRVPDIHATVDRLRMADVRFHGDIVRQILNDADVAEVVYCFAPEGTAVTLVQLPIGRVSLANQDA